MMGGRFSWLIVLGLFMLVWFAGLAWAVYRIGLATWQDLRRSIAGEIKPGRGFEVINVLELEVV